MELINSTSRNPLVIGDLVMVNGIEHILTGYRRPHKPASSGFVHVRSTDIDDDEADYLRDDEYYPSVINAEFFPRTDRGD